MIVLKYQYYEAPDIDGMQFTRSFPQRRVTTLWVLLIRGFFFFLFTKNFLLRTDTVLKKTHWPDNKTGFILAIV